MASINGGYTAAGRFYLVNRSAQGPQSVTTRCLVGGPDDQIIEFTTEAFRAQNGETRFDFNAFVPMPSIVRDTESGCFAGDGFFNPEPG